MPAQGDTYTATVDFYLYAGGPASDVTNLTVEVKEIATSTAIVGPTSAGIVHQAVGVYTYPWVISTTADLGDYLIIWSCDQTQATETVTVVASLAINCWASISDVSTITGGITVTNNDLTCAQGMIETLIHRVWRTTDTTRRDYVWLQRGVAWQAAFLNQHPEVKTMLGVQSMSQDGMSLSFPQGWKAYLAPLALRALDNLFRGSNSTIRLNSAFQKNRMRRGNLTSGSTPWYTMEGA